jgi:hypothetical protein
MFDLSQLAGLDIAFEFRGRKYDLRDMDFEKGAKFSKWVKDRAKDEAARTEGLPGEFDRKLASVLLADTAAGHYDWGGVVCVAALYSPEGAAHALLVALSDEEDPPDLEACRAVVKAKLNELAEFLVRQGELGKGRGRSSGRGKTSSRGAGTSRR